MLFDLNKQKKIQTSGYALVEVLMAAAIFGFALSVIMAGLVGSIVMNQASRNYTNATQHAQLIMEEIRNTSFGSIGANITAGNWTLNTAAVTAKGLTAINSEAITTTYTGTTLLDVTVTVSWNDVNQRARSLTLITSIANI